MVKGKAEVFVTYCWWKKSCTTWYGKYPIIYMVLYIPGGAGFLPWSKIRYLNLEARLDFFNLSLSVPWAASRTIKNPLYLLKMWKSHVSSMAAALSCWPRVFLEALLKDRKSIARKSLWSENELQTYLLRRTWMLWKWFWEASILKKRSNSSSTKILT